MGLRDGAKNKCLAHWIAAGTVLCSFFSSGCLQGQNTTGSGPYSATVSWSANFEVAVNSTGGGYRVYYSDHTGFNLNEAFVVNVPYVSGPAAPTSVALQNLQLHYPAAYYFRVVAYSNQPSPSGGTAQSAPSAETPLSVP